MQSAISWCAIVRGGSPSHRQRLAQLLVSWPLARYAWVQTRACGASSAKSAGLDALGELVGARPVGARGTSIRAGKDRRSVSGVRVLVEIGRREIKELDPLRMLKVSQNPAQRVAVLKQCCGKEK